MGNPSRYRICTSHVERKNGTLRKWCKRFTRLTYAFSKKWANLEAAIALHMAHYNFCRIHGSLRVTPAIESGLTDHVWTVDELIQEGSGMIEKWPTLRPRPPPRQMRPRALA